ncbi:hypothetical protein YA62_016150 [Agrobacterium sp. LC34]|uniref:hypothetical protein n=1 Tax=Rhizobium/Agrobacterium group TaxID=227290 RepID=UPI000629E279|nr:MULTISPECIES: hypothetical protein [Rhizobium/Agrobacterium group]KRA67540.1 hypothetical protein ASD85_23600 [Rhizobium sp. Root651]TKT58728.1 hypothetical protein YA62_016150 [Agrobacterium sp. LC34]
MISFLVVGGVGDQLYQLLCIAGLANGIGPRVCVSRRDEAKALYLAKLINKRDGMQNVFDLGKFKVLEDDSVAELLDFCQAHKKEGDLTGGFTAYAPEVGLVTCLWPDLSNDLGALFGASESWVNLYEMYSGARVTSGLDRNYTQIYARDVAMAVISGARSVFASPNANSVPIDMTQISDLITVLDDPAWNVVKVHSNAGNSRRLDIKSKSDESPLSEKFAEALTRQGIDTRIVGGDLVALHSEIEQSDLVLTVRSGLTDLAYFTGRSLLTYYPSMEIYKNYRMSRREVVLEELRGGGVCTALIHNQEKVE